MLLCYMLLRVFPASEITYIVSGGALNSTHSLTTCIPELCGHWSFDTRTIHALRISRRALFSFSFQFRGTCAEKRNKVRNVLEIHCWNVSLFFDRL